MKQAVKGASNWLKAHTKRDPVPYKLFESILNRQVKWGNDRGVNIDFAELSDAVKAELLKAGIYVMSPDGKQPGHKTASLFATSEESRSPIPALILSLSDNEPTLPKFFGWLHTVFDKATAEGITELRFSVNAVKENGHA